MDGARPSVSLFPKRAGRGYTIGTMRHLPCLIAFCAVAFSLHTPLHAAEKAKAPAPKAAPVAEVAWHDVTKLHYIGGDHLYGDDSAGATDASHANDLGFMRQADVMEPVIRAALR